MAQVSSRGLARRLRLFNVWLQGAAILFCPGIAAGLFPHSARAADGSLEYGVKATYLLRFAQFIEWPAGTPGSPDSTFNICVLGNNPFGNTLDQIVSGEVVNGRRVAVQKLDREPASGVCQILFLGENQEGSRSLATLGRGVLTVSEGVDFVRNGGMIGFVIENRRVTFDINRRAAEAAGLKLRSGLLSVARSVIK